MLRVPVRVTSLLACTALFGASVPLLGVTAAARFDGRPQFTEGKTIGYFLWRDRNVWKVRWTAVGDEHRFTGHVIVAGGELQSFERLDANSQRRGSRRSLSRSLRAWRNRVLKPGRGSAASEDEVTQQDEHRIHFATTVDDDVDGFDFTVGNRTEQIEFRLEIDGVTRRETIGIGARNVHPDADLLVAQLR